MIVSFIISAMSVLRRDITCTLHTQTPPCNTPHADSLTPYDTTHVLSQKPRESIEREAAATLLLQAHAKLIVIRTDRIVLLTATLLLQCALRCKQARSKQRRLHQAAAAAEAAEASAQEVKDASLPSAFPRTSSSASARSRQYIVTASSQAGRRGGAGGGGGGGGAAALSAEAAVRRKPFFRDLLRVFDALALACGAEKDGEGAIEKEALLEAFGRLTIKPESIESMSDMCYRVAAHAAPRVSRDTFVAFSAQLLPHDDTSAPSVSVSALTSGRSSSALSTQPRPKLQPSPPSARKDGSGNRFMRRPSASRVSGLGDCVCVCVCVCARARGRVRACMRVRAGGRHLACNYMNLYTRSRTCTHTYARARTHTGVSTTPGSAGATDQASSMSVSPIRPVPTMHFETLTRSQSVPSSSTCPSSGHAPSKEMRDDCPSGYAAPEEIVEDSEPIGASGVSTRSPRNATKKTVYLSSPSVESSLTYTSSDVCVCGGGRVGWSACACVHASLHSVRVRAWVCEHGCASMRARLSVRV